MSTFFFIFQIAVSLALIFLIAIQGKGGGLGSAFGANTALYSKRRGVEKIVFYLTVFLVFLFLAVSVVNLLA